MVALWPFVIALLAFGFVSSFLGEIAKLFSGGED
jgi:hypothetical protein